MIQNAKICDLKQYFKVLKFLKNSHFRKIVKINYRIGPKNGRNDPITLSQINIENSENFAKFTFSKNGYLGRHFDDVPFRNPAYPLLDPFFR